jgi:hypothetical protein
MKKIVYVFLIVFFPSASVLAQDDLLKMLQDETQVKKEPVIAMFKTNKLINIHTNETVRKRNLDVRISHLFGNMGKESGGGIHNLYGIDQSADIRIGFHYGISDHLMVGVSRAKRNEDLEGLLKYKFFDQTTDNAIPVSVSAFANMTYSVKESADFKNDTYRFVYCSQVILARKFSSRLSVVVIPTFTHRNFVGADDENNTWSLSGGFRFKFTPSASIIFDYSKTLGRENLVLPRYDVMGAGIEIETGGHVFTLMFSNASGILENDYLVNTFDVWDKGGYKLCFNISRMFKLGKDSETIK